MQTCGATRVLLPAAFVGLVMSVFAQNEPLSWTAAILTGLVTFAVQRARGRTMSCAVPEQVTTARAVVGDAAPDDAVDEGPVDDEAVTAASHLEAAPTR